MPVRDIILSSRKLKDSSADMEDLILNAERSAFVPRPLRNSRYKHWLVLALLCWLASPHQGASQTVKPTLLVDVDHRNSVSLDGDWQTIVDPYGTGLYTFHGQLRTDGFFQNQHYEPNGPLVEYDFSRSPTLRVPGDWNTQRPSLFYYEGPLWYEKDFEYAAKPHTRTFLHIGAANYHAILWVNAKEVCEHEGGFTPFDCEITGVLQSGKNFVVIAVDNTRHEDGVPNLQTDWWNYGGLTRDVSLVDVPEQFIDDYDLHLDRSDRSEIDGWVHVEGANPAQQSVVAIPEANLNPTSTVEADGSAKFKFHAANLTAVVPRTSEALPRTAHAAGTDSLADEIGFRTIEVRGTQILLNGQPIFLRGVSVHAEAPYRTGRAYQQPGCGHTPWLGAGARRKLCPLGTLSSRRTHDARRRQTRNLGLVRNSRVLGHRVR